jgi:hypothetical protein
VENLVLADRSCNSDKRDLLPAPPLVDTWAGRNRDHQGTLASLASVCDWDSDPEGTPAVARSIYRQMPTGLALFWSGAGHVDITHARPGIVIEIPEQSAAGCTPAADCPFRGQVRQTQASDLRASDHLGLRTAGCPAVHEAT